MAYEQPRVPIWREGNKLTDYIKELVRFLRSFTVAAWNADRLKDDEIKAIKALIESSAGGGGITVDAVYPVGSIYMSVNEISPAELFGGTWEQLKDRFLLGAGGSYALGSTGGEATHTLTVDEMPSHNHKVAVGEAGSQYVYYGANYGSSANDGYGFAPSTSAPSGKFEIYARNTGYGTPHNNMPPYFAVNMWKRTA